MIRARVRELRIIDWISALATASLQDGVLMPWPAEPELVC